MRILIPVLLGWVVLTGCPSAKTQLATTPAAPVASPRGAATGTYLLTELKLDGISTPVSKDRRPSLRIEEGGKFSGQTGVNRLTGAFQKTGATVKFGPEITTTRMAGPPEMMQVEARYLAALKAVTKISYGDTRLRLESVDGSGAGVCEAVT